MSDWVKFDASDSKTWPPFIEKSDPEDPDYGTVYVDSINVLVTYMDNKTKARYTAIGTLAKEYDEKDPKKFDITWNLYKIDHTKPYLEGMNLTVLYWLPIKPFKE